MKKTIIASLFLFSLVSCKKDYTCECTGNVIGIPVSVTTEAKSSKSGAEEWCKSFEHPTETVDGNPSSSMPLSCSIK